MGEPWSDVSSASSWRPEETVEVDQRGFWAPSLCPLHCWTERHLAHRRMTLLKGTITLTPWGTFPFGPMQPIGRIYPLIAAYGALVRHPRDNLGATRRIRTIGRAATGQLARQRPAQPVALTESEAIRWLRRERSCF